LWGRKTGVLQKGGVGTKKRGQGAASNHQSGVKKNSALYNDKNTKQTKKAHFVREGALQGGGLGSRKKKRQKNGNRQTKKRKKNGDQ